MRESLTIASSSIAGLFLTIVEPATAAEHLLKLPLSGYTGAETRAALDRQAQAYAELAKACPTSFLSAQTVAEIQSARACWNQNLYEPMERRHRARYHTTVQPVRLAEVATEVISPAEGVSPQNRQRILINLHGGSFIIGGGGPLGRIESMPVAALAKIKVVSIDYRMAPEARFPAATNDVIAVYRALLREHAPQDIGIFGCSAGSLLAAQVIAKIRQLKLPRPGALALMCTGAAVSEAGGDSDNISAAMVGPRRPIPPYLQYISEADRKNPLAAPGIDDGMMEDFPPTLLISGSRDFSMSSILATHAQLRRLGVPTELHVWEGMEHGFMHNPDFTESREAFEVLANFFNANLGRK